ncbi:uncharacterized protein LOC132990850 [Labrus mixtus]|uniref:uncharacterized protein LOC132990850 n=1 Tax=Labrus mixtus TaxID=508554 RepID=UPI0029BFD84F|nr:uncharacterized protein LOC132990850 [Labrus mixtus]
MPKHPEETRNVSVSPPGCWMWSDEAQTVEFISSCPAEEAVPRERKQTNSPFRELQLRSEWLAGISTLTHRGRQSSRKTLSPEHLNAYRSSVMKRQGDHVTIDDVKQVAVSLLQENYSLPIPLCFLALLKRKELDDVLTALLLYLSCFFEHSSLENKSELLLVDIIKERQVTAASLAKKAMAQKQLAVCYFSLLMDLEIEQHQRTSYRNSQTSSNRKEWLLHACLYSFFCYVAWVTFSRKDLKDIQEEVGRLFYSDTLNTSVRNGAHGDPEVTSSSVDGSVKTGEADPEETGSNRPFKRRHVKESCVRLEGVSDSRFYVAALCLTSDWQLCKLSEARRSFPAVRFESKRSEPGSKLALLLRADSFFTWSQAFNTGETISHQMFSSTFNIQKVCLHFTFLFFCSLPRSSQRRPPLSSIANQRSPLMVCLLPSPKDLSPHLFLGGRARRRSPLPADHCDTAALTEELNQQLADVSLGILGKPLCQLSGSDLIPLGETQKQQ